MELLSDNFNFHKTLLNVELISKQFLHTKFKYFQDTELIISNQPSIELKLHIELMSIHCA